MGGEERIVPDVLERRPPHRAAHSELLGRWRDEGRAVSGGALGDPPHGALIVFREGARTRTCTCAPGS